MIMAVGKFFDKFQQEELQNAVFVIRLFSSAPQLITDRHNIKCSDRFSVIYSQQELSFLS